MGIKLRNLVCSLQAENSCDSDCSSINRCKIISSISWCQISPFLKDIKYVSIPPQKNKNGQQLLQNKKTNYYSLNLLASTKSAYPFCLNFARSSYTLSKAKTMVLVIVSLHFYKIYCREHCTYEDTCTLVSTPVRPVLIHRSLGKTKSFGNCSD